MAEEDKKKQSDLAKMGDLNKAVGESSSETLSADENKKQEPAPADNDLKNELEREKEKNKSLAAIIEKVSSSPTENPPQSSSPAPSNPGPTPDDVKNIVNSQMKDVKDAVVAIGKKVEEVSKIAEKPERTSSKMKDVVDKMQADTGKKIEEMEEQIKNMITKLETPSEKKESVSDGLSAFGGKVGFKNEILSVRAEIKDMQSTLNELKDETDVRIDRIREQIKILDKIPTMNDKIEGLTEKMSPGNIEKLKKFIFSADEITGEIIPNEIEKRLAKQMTPFFNDLKSIRDDIEKVTENMKTVFNEINYFKGEIKTLYKFGDHITNLQNETEKMYSKISENKASALKMVANLEDLIKKRTDTYYEKINKFEKIFSDKLQDNVKDCFDDLTYAKFKELEDKTENHLAVSRAKINDMLSKFVQFQNVVNPTISMIKEQIETLDVKNEKLKDRQADLEEETVDIVKDTFNEIALPEIKKSRDETEKLSENVDAKLEDFQSEFTQYQNVVNPTLNLLKNDLSKIDNKFEKMKIKQEDVKESVNDLKSMRKSIESIMAGMKTFELKQGEIEKNIMLLGTKLGELREEFNNTLKQSMIDKKKLDDQAKKQKERVNILLKELKG